MLRETKSEAIKVSDIINVDSAEIRENFVSAR